MIRDYEIGDILKIKANSFVFENTKSFIENEKIEKYVLDDGEIVGIAGFMEYHPTCYEGFFILRENLSIDNIKQLKKLLNSLIIAYKPSRLQTTSEDCETINRWMKFLGFECEGTRKKYMYGKDFKMWSITNGI